MLLLLYNDDSAQEIAVFFHSPLDSAAAMDGVAYGG